MSKKLPSLCSPAFSSHHHQRHKFHSVSTGLSRTNRNFNVKREEGNRDSSCSLYLPSSPSLLKMLFPRYIEPEGKVVFYFSVLPFSVGVLWSRHDTLSLHNQLCYYTPRTPPQFPATYLSNMRLGWFISPYPCSSNFNSFKQKTFMLFWKRHQSVIYIAFYL